MTSQPSFIPTPVRRLPALVLGALLLSACAQLPQLGASPTLHEASDLAAHNSLSAPQGNWPSDHWWQGYGDSQLDSLIAEALRDAPSLAAAQARLLRAEGVAEQRGASLYPQLSGNASVNHQKVSIYNGVSENAVPKGYNSTGRITLDFSYEFDFWGKNHAALAAATSDLEAARADEAQARLTLATSIANSYADLARLYAERDTADAALTVRRETSKLIEERFANGLETQGSVKQAQAKRANAEAELLSVDESLALQRNALAALLGAGPDRGQAIARPTLKLDRSFALPAALQLELLGRRPDVQAARLRAESAAKRIDVAHAQFYPNVNLTALVGLQGLDLAKLGRAGSDIGGISPTISLPIFDAGRLKGQYRSARADYDEAVANYNNSLSQALRDVGDVTVSSQALNARLAKTSEAVEAAAEAHRIVRNRYAGGLANYLEVLNAEDALLSSLRQLVTLQARQYSLDIALVRALGGGYQATQS